MTSSSSSRMRLDTGADRARRIWQSLPGTSREISRKTNVPLRTVQRYLAAWEARRWVVRATRWYGTLRHTYVYRQASQGLGGVNYAEG